MRKQEFRECPHCGAVHPVAAFHLVSGIAPDWAGPEGRRCPTCHRVAPERAYRVVPDAGGEASDRRAEAP